MRYVMVSILGRVFRVFGFLGYLELGRRLRLRVLRLKYYD